ncbi:hypothetical protein [Alicyclobacillus acidocaldarius]|uniref:NurA domain-containing protein n=1 Tax=Alicyclobacillus acidocaldarius (strain Tc-4-1) TaxID=1048834 RepID=F8IIP6_ALIAT|nr:hypothetical protein [Alicyclobacillus acidocaldarius]AEJ44571.1 hypothetical protein TC41_2677 [Alicyclobacillus acidocaldarius subsp. acidocaldarius Tc-4-1]
MFDLDEVEQLKKAVFARTLGDARQLEKLCEDIRQLKREVRPIYRRSATTISLVASDGGDSQLQFDPFFLHVVRVVDSYGKQLCLDVLSPTTGTEELTRAQFAASGEPQTVLGVLMRDLGVRSLWELSPMIPRPEDIQWAPERVSPSWIQVYRDLCEWAALYHMMVYGRFHADTLVVRDGYLRSKVFARDLFVQMCRRIEQAMERTYREDRRRVFLVGIAKRSKVLQRYHMAILLESLFPPGEPRFVRVPREIEVSVYRWDEYARGMEAGSEPGEAPKFVAGEMYFVRFGSHRDDPIWAVDVLPSHGPQAQEIMGYLLEDAIAGFPTPLYPRCLQRAHEQARIGGLDAELLQTFLVEAIRTLVPKDSVGIFDGMQLRYAQTERRFS